MRVLDKRSHADPRLARLAVAGVLSGLALTGMGAGLFSVNMAAKSLAGTGDIRVAAAYPPRWIRGPNRRHYR